MTTKLCSGKIWGADHSMGRIYLCTRPATVEHNGQWYCWQHDPRRMERIEVGEESRTMDLEAIKSCREATSGGPWREWVHDTDSTYRVYGVGSWGVAEMTNPKPALRENDMKFIVRAHSDVPALVAEVEQLRERLFNAESDASFHRHLYTELREFTDEWKRRAGEAEAKIKQLCLV